jgi:hypothetical protein
LTLTDRSRRVPGAHVLRVYLHIGEPKTGTTFLQQAMWDNRARLAAQGVVLPGYAHRDHSRASRDLREAPRRADDPADPWAGEWDVLTRQALRVSGVAVISDEILAACSPQQAGRAAQSLRSADLHVIVTARDIASLLPAEWQETVKCRSTLCWEQWLADVMSAAAASDRRRRAWFWAVHDTLAILRMWSRHIPPDRLHVITVPRQAPADILWERFASVVGIDSTGLDLPPTRLNRSLGLAEAEFLRRMNEALSAGIPDWFYTRHIKHHVANDVLSSRSPETRAALTAGQRAWAAEQSEILAACLRDSDYHIVGDVRDLLSPTNDHCLPAPSLSDAQLLDAAVEAAAGLAERQYLDLYPAGPPAQARRSLWRRVRRLGGSMLNGPRTTRMLCRASHHPWARRLRVLIWCVLIRPGRYRPERLHPPQSGIDRGSAGSLISAGARETPGR